MTGAAALELDRELEAESAELTLKEKLEHAIDGHDLDAAVTNVLALLEAERHPVNRHIHDARGVLREMVRGVAGGGTTIENGFTLVDRAIATIEEFHISMFDAFRPEAVAEIAVLLSEDADWEQIAEWCGGHIHTAQDPSGEYISTIVLPNGEHAAENSWITLDHEGRFRVRWEVRQPETTPASRLART
ncbi:hypothetical protein [Agromyces humi]|uniref:hypothetical protein n=1 Tax=Agromyces humi TaxID=1766800 RepID=UPI00135B81E2|nr:hypothetical protein [Agromyces humi]